jgi:hypothetical protein
MRKHLYRAPEAHRSTIKSCVESGAGIGFLPDAPNFRYEPANDKPLHDGPPSKRGSVKVACSKRNCACKGSLWYRHEPLSAAPMYGLKGWSTKVHSDPFPLTDTDTDEAEAKAAWADGNPQPLRELLAVRAKERAALKIAAVCDELFERRAA